MMSVYIYIEEGGRGEGGGSWGGQPQIPSVGMFPCVLFSRGLQSSAVLRRSVNTASLLTNQTPPAPHHTHTHTVSAGRMTNQSAANQSNAGKAKGKEENQRDDNTEVAYKDAGHCSRNTHNLLLGLTVMGRQGLGNPVDTRRQAQSGRISEFPL